MFAFIQILRNGIEVSSDHTFLRYRPELYAAAGGELFVLVMLVGWVLTFAFEFDVLESNPLKDRFGYNNLIVGWITLPARYVAAPLFGLIVWCEGRFMMLDYWRASLNTNLTDTKKHVIWAINLLTAFGWFASSLIFVVPPASSPAVHTAAYVQLVMFNYIAYAANFYELPQGTHPRGSWVFLAIYGVTAFTLFCLCIAVVADYDESANTRGSIPWGLVAFFDYGWFACLGFQGFMRPKAGDVLCKMTLKSRRGDPVE